MIISATAGSITNKSCSMIRLTDDAPRLIAARTSPVLRDMCQRSESECMCLNKRSWKENITKID